MSALFAALPESGHAARARRSPAAVAISVVLHAAIVAVVVQATLRDADASAPRPAPPDVLIWFPPPPPAPTVARRSLSSHGPAAPGRRPTVEVRTIPPLPPLVGTSDIRTEPLPTPGGIVDLFDQGAAAGGEPTGAGAGPPEGGVHSVRQVEVPAAMLAGGRSPRYPESLRASRTEGRVVVQFVVDTTGRVEPGTVRVVSSSDDRFAAAVRTALPSLRFAPARAGGGRVRQLVELPFEFAIDR